MALTDELAAAGVGPGRTLAVALAETVGVGLAAGGRTWSVATDDPVGVVGAVEAELAPRWTWWGRDVPDALARAGVRCRACWEIDAVHQLLFGGARPAPAQAWATLHGLTGELPRSGQLDLLAPGGDEGGDTEDPVQPDGYLRPGWVDGGWCRTPERLAAWAALAGRCAQQQADRLDETTIDGDARTTAWSESAAGLLCAELQVDGLPVELDRALELVAAASGARPDDDDDTVRIRIERDEQVLQHARSRVDLRNPAQVRTMLAGIGVDLPDTRSWRLEPMRGTHPLIDALLTWRKAERIATTYGYNWLDEHVRDGRLRGTWLSSDGAAGRMTASAGLHNLPAELRPAVAADDGHVFVRADLGQVEPRVLAVVSGDAELAAAGRADDLYAPVASRLGVERPIAKVAVLAAMYGQTSGTAGQALRGLTTAYPTAMRYLDAAHAAGHAGRDVRTFGGRLVRMPAIPHHLDEDGIHAFRGSRGRYARNALVQGAAAEFFKTWAVTVRARAGGLGARIVLCLHDELLVHVPTESAQAAVELVHTCLDETAARWQRGRAPVRFVADVSVVGRWSDAKG